MNTRPALLIPAAFILFATARCGAEEVWATGNSLAEVIGYDLQAHATNQQLTDYQTNAVCLLLGYLRGFAESAAIAAHYDATAMPFFLPDTITGEQIEQAVYKFISDNPDKRAERGDAIVVAALTKEYPNPSFSPITKKQ
jgi:hypothetical protein